MAQNVSAVGTKITIVAVPTYPYGITISSFADDTNPLDATELTVADFTMGLNGDLVLNRRPTPISVGVNVIANTDEDKALEMLLDSNRVAKNKVSVTDAITMTVQYPDGMTKVLTNGAIISGAVINSIASSGKFKTKHYTFVFEGKVI